MKKALLAAAVLALAGFGAFAQDVRAEVRVSNAQAGGGTVYVAIFDSSEGLKKNKPLKTLTLEGPGGEISAEVLLPAGDYYVSAYQDGNGNGKLDTNLLGIPKEYVGIANFDGKGIPGGFDKHKLRVDGSSPLVSISLMKI